ncbi:ATP synthase mitochondrial F1 complex assembly factor 1 [Boleophthalmus pectinirostris]|uniref:ATP synthase mitochondrial F1 complex assembly factor 1 n=1 Tax=Boleophthalmus pectinirostris TaxID=150288 RepID=UPI00242EB38C|nr:ATP synthase mitochondrial F1 complex assembly factor 1 [Boleophthalmus pectinirostris]
MQDTNMAAGLALVSSRFRGLLCVRVPVARALVPGLGSVQTRTFALDPNQNPDPDQNLSQNPFYSKYREKIRELRSSDPEVYKNRLENRSLVKMERVGNSKQEEFIKLMDTTTKEGAESSRTTSGGASGKNKTLDSILNLDLVKDKTGAEISQIWTRYFSTRDTISAAIPTETFELMQKRSENCPTFLFVLPRSDGFEFFVGQWNRNELHFTSLINLQTRGDSAPSQLLLCHYTELTDKGIVLMNAEKDHSTMDVHEAQCLANQVQLFYGSRDGAFRLVEAFNHNPKEFNHMDVILALEQSAVI